MIAKPIAKLRKLDKITLIGIISNGKLYWRNIGRLLNIEKVASDNELEKNIQGKIPVRTKKGKLSILV